MRIDIMTDIETLGTDSDSTIIQISAIAFDIETGKHIATFNKIADIEKNIKPLKITGGTLKWWLNTDKELLTRLINEGDTPTEEVLISFHSWLTGFGDMKKVYLWGNGILFDNKMIQHQFEGVGLKYPIFYRNDRDLRTLVDLTITKLGITEEEFKSKYEDNNLTKHDAFDDCVFQKTLAVRCYDILTK